MDPARNPYTPWEGTPPPLLTGRRKILQQVEIAIKRAWKSKGTRGRIILGLQGTGKTVLLHRIGQMAEMGGCATILIEPDPNRSMYSVLIPQLHRLLLKLDQRNIGSRDTRNAFRMLKRFQGNASGDLLADLTQLFMAIGNSAIMHKTCVVLIIDEIHSITKNELGTLLLALDSAIQKKMPLILFGAGLPQQLSFTGRERSALERLLEVVEVGRLGRKGAIKALKIPAEKEGVLFETGALELALNESGRYPFFLQALGASIWEVAGSSPVTENDVASATDRVRNTFYTGLFKEKADLLTRRQMQYALAMASLDRLPARSTEVARVLGMNVSKAAPVRDEIIRKGIAFSPGRGLIAFSIPTFEEYLRRSDGYAGFTSPPG